MYVEAIQTPGSKQEATSAEVRMGAFGHAMTLCGVGPGHAYTCPEWSSCTRPIPYSCRALEDYLLHLASALVKYTMYPSITCNKPCECKHRTGLVIWGQLYLYFYTKHMPQLHLFLGRRAWSIQMHCFVLRYPGTAFPSVGFSHCPCAALGD